jgi:hypothetical protein
MSGSNITNELGVYGTEGTAAPNNVPGARGGAVSWSDSAGNLWLFGGTDNDGVSAAGGWFNDFWKYNAGEWTWISGSNQANQQGTYGIQGPRHPATLPDPEKRPLVGPMRPEISGSLVGATTTRRPEKLANSTTCGSIATGSGRG